MPWGSRGTMGHGNCLKTQGFEELDGARAQDVHEMAGWKGRPR